MEITGREVQEYLYKKHKYVREFILLYKSFPCLWRVKSKEYHKRDLRTDAYKVLVEKLKEIDPTADRAAVVKKVNSLRSSMRKEKKKIADLAKKGIVHQSKLWYYDLFNFLEDPGRTKEGDNNFVSNNVSEEEETLHEPRVKVEIEENSVKMEFDEDTCDEAENTLLPTEISQKARDASPKTNPRIEVAPASSSKAIPDQQRVTQSYEASGSPEDQHDVFGMTVAAKLRDIGLQDNKQRVMAEKIINDALFLAEMGQLTLTHCNILFGPIRE